MHSPFSPTILLSLCLSIGLILPSAAGSSSHSSTSLASPLYRRAPGNDPGHVQAQVDDLHLYLSKQKPTNVKARGGRKGKGAEAKLKQHVQWINSKLNPKKEKLRILFIEYAGSGGDVGKSMTYTEAIKSRSIYSARTSLFNRMLYYFHLKKDQNPHIEMTLAVDCNYLKYMTEPVRAEWAKDIKECVAGDGKNEKANQEKFMEVVDRHLRGKRPPHVVIQGNAISGLYKGSEGFWTQFHQRMDKMVKDDLILRINVRADFKQEKEVMEKKAQYPLEKNDVVLVGQPADFFPGLPSVNRQTRIGRPQVAGMSDLPEELVAWVQKQEQVMYLGLGGPQRSRELPKKNPTEAIEKFLKEIMQDEQYKDWSFIVFHNAIQPTGKEEKEPIENKRIYHVWYGINILNIFNQEQVLIAMHHCGRGILDDTIEAGVLPFCVGTSDFSDDQFEFAEVVEKKGLGRGFGEKADGVFFVDAKTDKYTGKEKSFAGQARLVQMFKDLADLDKYEQREKEVEKFRQGVTADTSGELSFEIMYNLKYYQAKRKPASLA
ncbi:MAG: hypothetical protein M1820_009329 [Bogoriella megaspora]|nr:MAG: hypothetical protein M1820_009329 [Bogoriella megaspora]